MDDDDATLLKMAKTRLSHLRMQESNLQKLTLKNFARNFRFYATNQIKEQNPELLPSSLQNKLLEKFSHHLKSEDQPFSEEEFFLRQVMFGRLINSQTLKVDLTGCLLHCNSEIDLEDSFVKTVLKNVLKNAPDLEELTFGGCSNTAWPLLVTQKWLIEWSQLRKLKSLKISSGFFFDEINNLLSVCQHLPNLQVIWATVKRIPYGCEPDLQYLESCFPSLIVHYIEGGTGYKMPQRFKNLQILLDELCCRNAKKLRKVYQSESKIFCVDYFGGINSHLSGRTIYTGSPGNFRRVSIEMMNEANELHGDKIFKRYYEDDWEEHPDRMVPVDEIKDSQEDSRFNCIRFVDGGSSFGRALDVYQTSCWQNVRTFTMENLSIWRSARQQIEIGVIAERLPNLERLIMKDASIVNSPELKFLNLSSLRDLQLDEPEYELERRPTPLSTIFSVAPNLEKARIKGTVSHFFAVEDLKVVTSMIVDGSILRNLQKLHILLRAVSSTDCVTTNQQIPDENIKQVIKFLKTASAFLPRLTEIELTTLDSRGSKIRFSGNSKGNILPTDTDSIFERHRFQDFLAAFQ